MARALLLVRWLALIALILVGLGLIVEAQWRGLKVVDLFWQGIIPLVPLLLLLAPHVWRQICPVAAVNLAGPRLARGNRAIRSARLPGGLARQTRHYGLLIAAALLWVLVPLRLLIFNASSQATGVLVLAIIAAAGVMGFLMPWKSGWCASLCPVYPVEKLYGASPLWRLGDPRCIPQAKADGCFRCALRCIDVPASDLEYWSAMYRKPLPPITTLGRQVFVGSFPGFMLAYLLLWWFVHLPPHASPSVIMAVYAVFVWLMAATYGLYWLARKAIDRNPNTDAHQDWRRRLDALSILLALNIYYIVGGTGLGTVAGKLDANLTPPLIVAITVVTLVLGTSLLWLVRSWNTPAEQYAEW